MKKSRETRKKDPTAVERDRRYRAARKRAGFKHVRVFVPGGHAEKIRKLARKLRRAAAKP